MPETLPDPPNEEQLLATLIQTHGEALIKKGGGSFTLNEFNALGAVLCPFNVEDMTPKEKLEYQVKELHESGVKLSADYIPYFPPQETNNQDIYTSFQTSKENTKVDKEKPVAIEAPILRAIKNPVEEMADIANQQLSSIKVPAKIYEKETKIEPRKKFIPATQIIKKVVEFEPIKPKLKTVEKLVKEPPAVRRLAVVKPSEIATVLTQPHSETIIPKRIILPKTAVPEGGTILEEEPKGLTVPELIQSEKGVDLDESAMTVTENTIEIQLDNASEIIIVATDAEFTVADAEPMISQEFEALEFAEGDETVPVTAQLLTALLAPNRQLETAGEQAEAAALVSEVVTSFLQELAPEQLVEIEAQIEQIILVADRLHFLVENDAGDCEEALLIDAFLARKFTELLTEIEPILEALNITIDDETIAAFIAYVRSDKYQSKADLLANFIEIQSEGTHEKKLFKEAGVFKKAQQASQIWQLNMQSMLGRITLNNAA